ncbi:hypothetical protein TrVE_jg14003 [Triparma verrucosa]|uniref:Uncharacterized protein n=1 Tax=Triparma verrucosa TaxID=1606542 RepID=A0A9W7FH37_9STRA|nr:hypothetical protein TrVE_jg14003 [Triparma verrucosa]
MPSPRPLSMELQLEDAEKSPAVCCDKYSACPGCCDLCTGKCNFKKVMVSLLILFACFFGLIGAAEVAGIPAWDTLMQLLGITDCGWLKNFQDKNVVCVEVPPKVVPADEGRRFLRSRFLAEPSAEEQSMEFSCADDAADPEACAAYCNADHIYVKQVFLVEDEDDDRDSWSGNHIQVVSNEKTKNFNFRYSLGCESKDAYLSQDFGVASVNNGFQCGYSEIGYDLYHNVPTSDCALSMYDCESNKINGETYWYATMSNLLFGPDLQEAIINVKEGRAEPGVIVQSYPKSYDHIVAGCVATYKVDFVIPEDYRNATIST